MKTKLQKYIALFFLCLCPMLLASPVYKYVGEDGVVTYSDTPQPGSVQIEVKPIQQYQAPSGPASPTQGTTMPALPTPQETTYTDLSIKEPKEGDIFSTSTETVTVLGSVTPDLDPAHQVVLTLDGKPYGTPQNMLVFTIGRLERGLHTVQLAVIDPANPGKPLISSKAVTFRQYRVSKLYPAQEGVGMPTNGSAPATNP